MFGELATKIGGLGLDQGIFTNGYLIDRFEDVLLEHFTYIRISLDAGSKEVHAWGMMYQKAILKKSLQI